MKITAVKGIPLGCTCSPISDALSTSAARQALLVRIETDSGYYGIGEAFTYGAPLAVMKYIVEMQLAPILMDQDPVQIEKHWNTMYWRTIAHGRRSMIMGAISGIDIALWDLLGKICHMPVYKLLGACSDMVPSYASGGFYAPGKGIDGLRAELEGYMEKGYQDAKIKIGRNLDRPGSPLCYMANQECSVTVEEDIRRMETAREVLGTGRLMVEQFCAVPAVERVRHDEDFVKHIQDILDISNHEYGKCIADFTKENFNLLTEHDRMLHTELVKCSRNQQIMNMYNSLNAHSCMFAGYGCHTPKTLRQVQDQHTEIVNQLLLCDVDGLRKALESHIYSTVQIYRSAWKE